MSDVVTITITNEKQGVMKPEYNVLSVDILKEVNKIPIAQLVLLDGDVTTQKFEISDTNFFEPGQIIEIQLRYEGGKDETVFKGIIIKHSIQADKNGSFLSIYLKDAAIQLTTIRKSVVFLEQTDQDIIKKIVQDSELEAGEITSTQTKHQQMVQFYCTDWDFIVSRADANGCWVLTDDGKISVLAPELKNRPKHTFEYGISEIYEFEMDADIYNQYQTVESISWDVNTQQLSDPKTGKEFSLTQGNLQPANLASSIGADKYQLINPGQLTPDEMQAWANAKIVKSRLSMFRGRIMVPGFADIKPGDMIKVAGIGKRFNGKTLVTGIRHQVSNQGWQTDVQFGLSANWFSQNQNNNIIDTPAAGLVPAINGLHIGLIVDFEEDSEEQYRIKVKVPTINDKIIWARLVSLYAGQEVGISFRPEKDSEVVLGFVNDDPRQAVILGCLSSKTNAPPYKDKIKAENNLKVIKTREHEIVLDDEEQQIGIVSKNGNSLTFSKKGIKFEDVNKNVIEANDSGLTIKSGKDINIEGQNITLKGSKVDVN